MPRGSFWNVPMAPDVKYTPPQEYILAVKEAQRAARSNSGGRQTDALKQLMAMNKQMMAANKAAGFGTSGRRGGTAKEREKAAAADRMQQAQRAVFDDANFQEQYAKAQTLSAQKASDMVADMKKTVGRYAAEYDVEPDQLSQLMMGKLSSQVAQNLKDVQSSRGDFGWEGFWGGMKRFGRALKRPFLSDEEAEADMRKGIEERLELERTNAYARDQALRAQEGEGAWSRAEGWGMLANSAEAVGNMLPQVAAAVGGRSLGSAVGAGVGAGVGFFTPVPGGTAGGAELGAQIGGLIGTAVGGGTAGGLQGRYDYVERVLNDPNLTEEQKREALEGWGITGATAANAALGAIPLGFRDAAKLAAPRIGFTAAGKEVGELAAKMGGDAAARKAALSQVSRRQLIEEAERGYLGNLPNSLKWGGIEAGTMLGVGVPLNNAIYGSGTEQDVDLTEGLQEAAVMGIPLAALIGFGGAKPRMSRARIEAMHPNWRKDGSIKPDVASYRAKFAEQSANPDIEFGGRETQRLLMEFKKDYPVAESFTALVEGLEPAQRTVLKNIYESTPQQRVAGTGDNISRAVDANPRSSAPKAKEAPLTIDEQVAAMREVFTNRIADEAAWNKAKQENPKVAKHVEEVSMRLGKMDSKVREFYERLRTEPTSVQYDEILRWLAESPDAATMQKNRADLISVLTDARGGNRDNLNGRIYSFEKLDGINELVRSLQSIHGKKWGLEEIRDIATTRGWNGGTQQTAATPTQAQQMGTAPNQTLINNAQQVVNNAKNSGKQGKQTPPVNAQTAAQKAVHVPTGTISQAVAAQNALQNAPTITPANVHKNVAKAGDYVKGVGAVKTSGELINYGKKPNSDKAVRSALRKRWQELPDDFKQWLSKRVVSWLDTVFTAEEIMQHQVKNGTLTKEAAAEQTKNYATSTSRTVLDDMAREAVNRGLYGSGEEARAVLGALVNSLENKKIAPDGKKLLKNAASEIAAERKKATPTEPKQPAAPEQQPATPEQQPVAPEQQPATPPQKPEAKATKPKPQPKTKTRVEKKEDIEAALDPNAEMLENIELAREELVQLKAEYEKSAANAKKVLTPDKLADWLKTEAGQLRNKFNIPDDEYIKIHQWIDDLVNNEGAINEQGTGNSEQGLGRNEPAGAAVGDKQTPVGNKSVEAATPASSEDASNPPSQSDVRGDNPAKSGGDGGATTPNKRQSKKAVPDTKQKGTELGGKQPDPGRRVSTAADDLEEGNPRARGAASKNRRGKNQPKSQKSDSGEQQASGKGVEQEEPAAPVQEKEQPVQKPEAPAKVENAGDEYIANVLAERISAPDGAERLALHIDALPDDVLTDITGIELNAKRGRRGEEGTSNANEIRKNIYRAIFNTIVDPPESGASSQDKAIVTRLHDMSGDGPRVKASLMAIKELADDLYQAADVYRTRNTGADGLPLGIDEAFAEIMSNEGIRTRLLDVQRGDAETNVVTGSSGQTPTITFSYRIGEDGSTRTFTAPVDTPGRVYDAIRAITMYGEDLASQITHRPMRDSDGNLRMNNVEQSQREMLSAFFRASNEGYDMTATDKKVWHEMEKAGFEPLRFSEQELASIENTAEDLYNVQPDVYFANQYFTGKTIDEIMNGTAKTIC